MCASRDLCQTRADMLFLRAQLKLAWSEVWILIDGCRPNYPIDSTRPGRVDNVDKLVYVTAGVGRNDSPRSQPLKTNYFVSGSSS